MDLSKFTERARGFIQAAQTVAIRENHQRILPEHILKALLDDDQGFASNLITAATLAPTNPSSHPTTSARLSTSKGRRANHASNASTSYRNSRIHGAIDDDE